MSDYVEHVRSLVQNYLTQRKVVGNELIGKNVLLLPPFNFSVIIEGGAFRVDIEGSHGKFSTICQWVSISPFRDDISFVMPVKGAKPTIRKLTPLQPARRRMLDIVKPGTSMDATTFYRATASEGNTQVNARRRWGELRTEYGFETVYTGTRFARGSELPTNEPSPRPNMVRLNNAFLTQNAGTVPGYFLSFASTQIESKSNHPVFSLGQLAQRTSIELGPTLETALSCNTCESSLLHPISTQGKVFP